MDMDSQHRVNSADFGKSVLSLVSHVVPVSGCCFYRVDEERHIADHMLEGLSERWLNEYDRTYWRLDPLHPTRVRDGGIRIASIGPPARDAGTDATAYFKLFLLPQGTVYQTELYFRAGGKIIAGASILRDPELGPLSPNEFAFLERVIALAEQALTPSASGDPVASLGLTARESEIARLIARGLCNKEICRRLGIELPTVKTHVTRIFRKTGARNRAALMKRLYWGEA